MKKATTKRALLFSVVGLLLCCTMLIGTTFAWFTDTASSQANKIQAGTLDVVLYEKQGNEYVLLDDERPVFDYDKWEPGFTAVEELLIKNEGSLALRYQVKLQGLEALDAALTKGIENVLEVSINDTPRGTLADFADGTNALLAGALIPAEDNSSVALKIQIHMREDAGNEYQAAVLPDFDILVTAAQYTYESDSFDNQYDAAATPEFNLEVYVPVAVDEGAVAETVIVKENVTVTVPPTVLVGGEPLTADKTLKLAIKSTATDPVFEAAAGTGTVVSMDISLTDSEGNAVTAAADPIPVVIPLAPGLFNVTVLHDGVPMAASEFDYDDATGKLTIYATSFSPYTVGYDTVAPVTIGEVGYATIQAAMDAAISGDVIALAPGSFALPATIGEGITLSGSGANTIVKVDTNNTRGNGSTPNGIILDQPNITLEGLVLTADESIGADQYNSVVRIEDGGITLNNLQIPKTTLRNTSAIVIGRGLGVGETFTLSNTVIATGGFKAIHIVDSCKGKVVVDNCDIDSVYPINVNSLSSQELILEIKNSKLHGWTSYGSIGAATFTNTEFTMGGSGYNYVKPYTSTTFTGCSFSADYKLGAGATGLTITIDNCVVGGVPVTVENIHSILDTTSSDGIALLDCTVIVNGVTVVFD